MVRTGAFSSAVMRRLWIGRAMLAALLVFAGLGPPAPAAARPQIECAQPGPAAAVARVAAVFAVADRPAGRPADAPTWTLAPTTRRTSVFRHAYQATGPPVSERPQAA